MPHYKSYYATLIREAAKMTQFIHDRGVNRVIVGGTSAQAVAYMVKQIWKRFYPNENLPKFTALGVMHHDTVVLSKEGEEEKRNYNPKAEEVSELKRNGKYIRKYFQRRPVYGRNLLPFVFTKILDKHLGEKKNPEEKIFILEEMAHSFSTMDKIKGSLEYLGYKNILTGALLLSIGNARASELDYQGIKCVHSREYETPLRHLYRTRSNAIIPSLRLREARHDPAHHESLDFYLKQNQRHGRSYLKKQRSKIRRLVNHLKK